MSQPSCRSSAVMAQPTSALQAGILYECLLNKQDKSLYVSQMVINVALHINVVRFEEAINQTISVFPILKSFYTHQSQLFTQYICEELPAVVIKKNINLLSDQEKERIFEEYLKIDRQFGIDPAVPPLMRFAIFQFNETDCRLVWTRHHVLMDGNSAATVLKKIFEIYNNNSDVPLDSISSLNNNLIVNSELIDVSYWKKSLEKYSECSLSPPVNHLEQGSIKEEPLLLLIDKSLYQRLKKFKIENNFTFNSILLAIWSIAISHYSNNRYIALGSVRGDLECEDVGLRINTLPIIADIDPAMKVLEFISLIKQQLQALKKNIFTPLIKIKNCCGLKAKDKLFEMVIDYKPVAVDDFLNCYFPTMHFKTDLSLTTPHLISLEIINKISYLIVKLSYDSNYYTRDYMSQILNHFLQLIDEITLNPNQFINDLSTMSVSDYQKVLFEWNQSKMALPRDKSLVTLFEEGVSAFPEKEALVFENIIMTYRELNARANQLAHHLISENIKSEDIVAIFLESELEFVIAIIGVLKAGGAYLPIDSQQPMERIHYFLEDSGAKYLVTEKDKDYFFNQKIKKIIFNNCQKPDSFSADNPNIIRSSNNLVYIIYTSGSTGKPKGVMIESLGVINLWKMQYKLFDLTQSSRVLQLASFGFDSSVFEIFPTLLSSAVLCIAGKKARHDPIMLANFMDDQKVTIATIWPSYLSRLSIENLNHLKCLTVAGEKFKEKNIKYAKTLKLFNGYGPTEATVCSTIKRILVAEKVTIGKILPNTEIYILDYNHKLSPINSIGEIYIAGIGLARGYINNKEVTDKKFLNIEVQEGVYKRLYRTGDLGKWLETGEIEFIDRVDNVIKFNGFRIGLDDIETVLVSFPHIVEAAVYLNQEPKNAEIVAFVMSNSGAEYSELELRKYLISKLPHYMIPHKIIFVENFLYNLSGKLDCEQLYRKFSHTSQPTQLGCYDETEKFLINVIKKISNCSVAAVDQNIFDLGLNSLSIMQLCRAIQEKYKLNLKVSDFFIYTTVRQLKELILNYNNEMENYKIANFVKKKTIVGRRVIFNNE